MSIEQSATRSIKPKAYKVYAPDGKQHLAYASTEAGAIRDVREHLKKEETWSAELATGTDLYQAGIKGTPILNGPQLPADDEDQERIPLDPTHD